jgi:hypothetical protein
MAHFIYRQLKFINNALQGPNVEKQRCFSPQPSKIPFAKDPTIIEQEILGGIPNRLVLQQQKASQFQQHQQQQG